MSLMLASATRAKQTVATSESDPGSAPDILQRQKALVVLARCLCQVSPTDSPGVPWNAVWAEVAAAFCARGIEAAAWDQAHQSNSSAEGVQRWYRGKLRFLAAALSNTDNASMRDAALCGQISGSELVALGCDAFLSDVKLQQRKKDAAAAMSSVSVLTRFEFRDERLVCPACAASGARYTVLREPWAQTGQWAARTRKDLGKHVLAECAVCGERWQESGL
eukprot:TRINITY_DN109099_c0_g1_i1.p1 TRINITY_DN109099_c0_g1~~TRINITY_DN109099_c0_g1_i1.p1  ORF type:complete len:221 (-),score=40.18 TRINITY_DN109099_c0_g1_i1:183-845(-)